MTEYSNYINYKQIWVRSMQNVPILHIQQKRESNSELFPNIMDIYLAVLYFHAVYSRRRRWRWPWSTSAMTTSSTKQLEGGRNKWRQHGWSTKIIASLYINSSNVPKKTCRFIMYAHTWVCACVYVCMNCDSMKHMKWCWNGFSISGILAISTT